MRSILFNVLVVPMLVAPGAGADGPMVSKAGARDPIVNIWRTPRPLIAPAPTVGGIAGGAQTYLTANSDPEGDMPRDVAFTPDGLAAVIVNRDTDTVTFFDVATQAITHTVDVEDFPVDIAVTPDGQYAIAPNVLSNTVSIIDIATHTVAAHVPVTGDQPFAVAVTTDSAFAVVALINDAVNSAFSVIDLGTLSESHTIATTSQGVIGGFFTPESGIFGNLFTQFALSPDDSTIVLPDRPNDRVQIYELATGAELASLATADAPLAVDISDDGLLAVVSHEGGGSSITKIDLVTRTVTGNFPTDNLTGQIVRITPDKSHAMAAISNNVIFVNLTSGATTATLFTGVVGDIEISYDGQYAFVSNFNARVIDIASQAIVRTIPFAACVDSATSPTELRAVALNNRFREDIHLYNINGAAGAFEGFALSGEPAEGDATRNIAMSPDGSTAVAGNNTSRNVTIYDMTTREVRSYVDTGDRILDVAITPDGAHAVVPNTDSSTVSIIDLSTDTEVANLNVPTRPAKVVISPDSQEAYVLTVAGTDRIYFIDLDGGASTVTGSIIAGQTGSALGYSYTEISGIQLSPDGSLLGVCVSFDDELLLIDTATHTEIIRVPVGDFPMRVEFAADNSKAYVANAFGDSVSVVVVDGASSFVEATVPGIEFPLTINIDPANEYVYVGSSDGSNPTMKVISTASNSIVASVPMNGASREAHLTPDGLLYSATTASELAVIDAAGPASAVIDTIGLSGSPSDLAFNEATGTAVMPQPVHDGIDIVRFGNPADLNGDGMVGPADLAIVLGNWGPCPDPPAECPADLNGDGEVGPADLAILLGNWG